MADIQKTANLTSAAYRQSAKGKTFIEAGTQDTNSLIKKALQESEEQAKLAEESKRASLEIALRQQSQNEINRPLAQFVDMMGGGTNAMASMPNEAVDTQKVIGASSIPGGDYLKGPLALAKLEETKANTALMNSLKAQKTGANNIIRLSEKYKADKSTKDIKDKLMAMGNVESIVFSDLISNPVAINMAKRMLVRASGDPRPSDKDVEAFGNIPSLKNKVQALGDKLSKGELLTAEDKEAWKELINIQKAKTRQQFDSHNQAWKQLGTTAYGVDPETSDQVIVESSGYLPDANKEEAPTENVIKWGRDKDGNPVRL